MEYVGRVVHPIDPEDSLQASFVETGVVRHEGESFDERCNLLPDIWEHGCVIGILGSKSVHLLAEPLVVLRFWMYETVERILDFSVTDYHHPDGAYA